MLEMPSELKPFVNDYKMRLIEVRDSKLQLYNVDNNDLFNLLEIMLDKFMSSKDKKKKLVEYCENHHVDSEVEITACSIGGYEKQCKKIMKEKGEFRMGYLLDDIVEESRKEAGK